MPIHVKLEKFEGPLGLLLELIEAKKLEISEVSLAEVTDQYLTFMRDSGFIQPEHLADFLVVASQLLLIKSRVLLPSLELSPEEEEEIKELEFALKEYRRYKEATQHLRALLSSERVIATRALWQGVEGGFFGQRSLSGGVLHHALLRSISALVEFLQPLEKSVIQRTLSIEAKIKEILKRVEKKATATLRELAGSRAKLDLIVAFLAILFLFKEKVIHLAQTRPFGEIRVTKNSTA